VSVALISEKANLYGTVKLVINGQAEIDVVAAEAKRESSRFAAGFLPVMKDSTTQKGKIFYVIE
jgi:hypothetical protein